MKRTSILLCALSVAACGGLSYRVDRDLLRDISIENKLLLFDAENDVSIALDERENLRRQISELRRDIADSLLQIKEAEKDYDRAKEKSDAVAMQVADLAQEVYEYKVRFLKERVAFLRERVDIQDSFIYVAWAKYELAKAKLVKKNNVRGASDIDIEDFEQQVDKYVGRARSDQEDLKRAEELVNAAENEWRTRREKLQQASGGGVGSAWAEDSAQWGY